MEVLCPHCCGKLRVSPVQNVFKCPFCYKMSALPGRNQPSVAKPAIRCPNTTCVGVVIFYNPGQSIIPCPKCRTQLRPPPQRPQATQQRPFNPSMHSAMSPQQQQQRQQALYQRQQQLQQQQQLAHQQKRQSLTGGYPAPTPAPPAPQPQAKPDKTAEETAALMKRLQEVEAQLAAAQEAQASKQEEDNEDATVMLAWTPEQVLARDEKIDEFFQGPVLQDFAAKNKAVVDIAYLRERFNELDVDGDGQITMQQLVDFLIDGGLDETNAKRHVKGFCRMVNFSTDENINFDAFCEELNRMQNYILMKSIQMSFSKADKDHNNRLDREEFVDLLTTHYGSEQHAKRKVVELFDQIDTDQNGSLSLQEVAEWYFTKEVSIKAKQKKMQNELSAADQRLLEEKSFIEQALVDAESRAAVFELHSMGEKERQLANLEAQKKRRQQQREMKKTQAAMMALPIPEYSDDFGATAVGLAPPPQPLE